MVRVRLLTVYNKKCHPHPPQSVYMYKLVFLCEVQGENIQTGFDIEGREFFNIDHIPVLSEGRILESQIKQLYPIVMDGYETVYFD